ncbi:Hypothetical_protein [Hexamita inflata]|uniref:Hypothetical_protein n=1 Tax=Hexamita inflata TaxID=28002 RepID=A0AA86NHJ4_9EUKA|nr:Hypothetical protein HINF_LOCUS7584 [Hexamita inflata]CAI9946562.1 Hypothetical protein HINF_LOCUS34207 [Hexamita inflata]CAI9947667.1 Hypothetical protein HINF_LOCUS35312 [Hexamita inflata]
MQQMFLTPESFIQHASKQLNLAQDSVQVCTAILVLEDEQYQEFWGELAFNLNVNHNILIAFFFRIVLHLYLHKQKKAQRNPAMARNKRRETQVEAQYHNVMSQSQQQEGPVSGKLVSGAQNILSYFSVGEQ